MERKLMDRTPKRTFVIDEIRNGFLVFASQTGQPMLIVSRKFVPSLEEALEYIKEIQAMPAELLNPNITNNQQQELMTQQKNLMDKLGKFIDSGLDEFKDGESWKKDEKETDEETNQE
jgi:hypothetical protein